MTYLERLRAGDRQAVIDRVCELIAIVATPGSATVLVTRWHPDMPGLRAVVTHRDDGVSTATTMGVTVTMRAPDDMTGLVQDAAGLDLLDALIAKLDD